MRGYGATDSALFFGNSLDAHTPMGYPYGVQTVVELPIFSKQAAELFSAEEITAVITFLAANPYAGDKIQGTGGVRKVRFAAKGKGKRGGARIIYYVLDDNAPIYALLVYGKDEKSNLTDKEKAIVKSLAAAMKSANRSK